MNREDIIRMARACFDVHMDSRGRETFSGDHHCVEELVTLVTKAEREACAKVCEAAISRISDAAIIGFERRDAGINVCSDLADAIRARGQA